jgi:hypothetical protein
MHDRDDNLRRSQSESSYPRHLAVQVMRNSSHSTEKIGEKKAEDLEEQSLLERVIERLPGSDAEWKMEPFEKKLFIAGLKCRMRWVWTPRDLFSVFKFSFTNSFFSHMGTITEGDLIVELESLNFELSQPQKQLLQEKVEEILAANLEVIKTRGFGEAWSRQS